jgi:hypothetical protein
MVNQRNVFIRVVAHWPEFLGLPVKLFFCKLATTAVAAISREISAAAQLSVTGLEQA